MVVEGSAVDVEPFLELRQDAISRSVPRLLHARQALDTGRRKVTPSRFDLVERHENLLDQSKARFLVWLWRGLGERAGSGVAGVITFATSLDKAIGRRIVPPPPWMAFGLQQ